MRIRKSPRSINTTRLMAAERAKRSRTGVCQLPCDHHSRKHQAAHSAPEHDSEKRWRSHLVPDRAGGCSITNSVGVFASEVSRAVTRCPSATRMARTQGWRHNSTRRRHALTRVRLRSAGVHPAILRLDVTVVNFT